MRHRILWSLVAIVVIAASVFLVIFYIDTDDDKQHAEGNEENTENVENKENEDNEVETSSGQKQTSSNDSDPFNGKYKQAELTDTHFRNYIHKMSHQKVEAEDKWGFYEMTDERIAWLLEALETEDVQRQLTDADTYLDILNRWQDDDFSQVDKDHNMIWKLQGGTVGKANGILDEEQEAEYIENTAESK